jgi:hypothetical protein
MCRPARKLAAISLALAALLAAAACGAPRPSLHRVPARFERALAADHAEVVTLEQLLVHVPHGSVRIEPGEGLTIAATTSVYGDSATEAEMRLERFAASPLFERLDAHTGRIAPAMIPGVPPDALQIRLRLVVPPHVRVRVETNTADVTVDRMTSLVDVHTRTGRLNAHRSNRVECHTSAIARRDLAQIAKMHRIRTPNLTAPTRPAAAEDRAAGKRTPPALAALARSASQELVATESWSSTGARGGRDAIGASSSGVR